MHPRFGRAPNGASLSIPHNQGSKARCTEKTNTWDRRNTRRAGKNTPFPSLCPIKRSRLSPLTFSWLSQSYFGMCYFSENAKVIHWIKSSTEEKIAEVKITVLWARRETLHDIGCNLLPHLESLCRLSIDSIPSHPILLESISQVC